MSLHSPVVDRDAIRARDAALRRIQEYLARHIVNQEDVSEAYIKYADIREVWSGYNTVQTALYPTTFTDEELEELRRDLLRFISILVYIGAWEVLSDFRAQFYEPSGGLVRRDAKLPLRNEEVHFLKAFKLRSDFLTQQYLFIPEVIVESATVKHVDDKIRLPFEQVDKNFSAGAYGKIDRIKISAHHLMSLKRDINPEAKIVACKRFHPRQDLTRDESQRELKNLQVLKESISMHENVRLHLAILFHKGEHLIILPWAAHLDLEVFLLEGHDYRGNKIYDFRRRFPHAQPGAILAPACVELYHVADALRWLHGGITPRGTHQNKICFAHMDLKPNNILIDEGASPRQSPVGTWVLTDFGISAFKEDDGEELSNFVSVRDYYNNLTIDTKPRRQPGAYQPPEVEHDRNTTMERGITREEGHAGRRGDIWSFACIFSEVLVFSLGGTALLKDFRQVRKGRREGSNGTRYRTDYFYEEVLGERLHPNAAERAYRVRPWISEWLRNISEHKVTPLPNNAIDCCVETILEILITDGSRRPNAEELFSKLNHVVKHVVAANGPGGRPTHCPLDRLRPQQPNPDEPFPDVERDRRQDSLHAGAYPNAPWSDDPGSRHPTDSIPPAQSPLSSGLRHLGLPGPQPDAHVRSEDAAPPSPSIIRSTTVDIERIHDGGRFGIPDRTEEFNQTETPEPSTAHGSETEQLPIHGRPILREPRRELHGMLLDQDPRRERTPRSSNTLSVARPDNKVVGLSLCPSGQRVAYLTQQKSQFNICLYALSLSTIEVHEQSSIPLPDSITWQGVQIAGDYLTAWGHTVGGNKKVYIASPTQSKLWAGPANQSLASLSTVAISKHGSLALVCSKSIIYTVAAIELLLDDSRASFIRTIVPAKDDHSFTHAAFNDDGGLLYAWEFGRPDDRLSVFRIGTSRHELSLPPDSEGSYQSKKQRDPTATLIPYNSYHGCIIQAHGGTFFPAQIRSTQRGSSDKLPKITEIFRKAIAACVFNDHSLLVIIKEGLWHYEVKEFRIAGGAMQVIERPRKDENAVIKIRSSPDKGTQMRVVAVSSTDNLVVVICMPTGKLEFIPITT